MSSTSAPTTKAWVTLLTRTSYLAGALVLHQSLQKHKSAYPLIVFATKELPLDARQVLQSKGIRVRDIEYLEPKAENKGELVEHDRRFADTWTKLRCFEMVEYERVVMLDSDMLVIENMDELMTLDLPSGWIAAAHACACNPRKLSHYPTDWIPENCAHTLADRTTPLSPAQFTKPTHHLLNSGLVVLHPSLSTFEQITKTLHEDPKVKTFKFPDQDLLAYVFGGRFLPLSYRYNALKTLRYCHAPMWRDDEAKNVHYILDKPWNKRVEKGDEDANAETHSWWWNGFEELEATWGDAPNWELVESTVAAKTVA